MAGRFRLHIVRPEIRAWNWRVTVVFVIIAATSTLMQRGLAAAGSVLLQYFWIWSFAFVLIPAWNRYFVMSLMRLVNKPNMSRGYYAFFDVFAQFNLVLQSAVILRRTFGTIE